MADHSKAQSMGGVNPPDGSPYIYPLQIVRNHIVQGLVYGSDLEDDLVGTTIGGTKLRDAIQ